MLVVINGVETLEKRFFANKIRLTMNPPVTVGGYTVDYRQRPWSIRDGDVLVYGVDEQGNAVNSIPAEDLTTIDREYFNRYARLLADTHYYYLFEDVYYECGFCSTMESLADGYTASINGVDITYQKLVDDYRSSDLDYYTITGVFSPSFIKKIKSDVGASNVIVVNLVRNPSTCRLLHYSPVTTYEGQDYKRAIDSVKLMKSLYNAKLVGKMRGTITVKFEDVLANGGFDLKGTWISIPEPHANYNGTITQWEKSEAYKAEPYEIDLFNEDCIDWHMPLLMFDDAVDGTFHTDNTAWEYRRMRDVLDIYNRRVGTTLTVEQVDAVRTNLFTDLGYNPLTYNDIVKPDDTQSQAV